MKTTRRDVATLGFGEHVDVNPHVYWRALINIGEGKKLTKKQLATLRRMGKALKTFAEFYGPRYPQR